MSTRLIQIQELRFKGFSDCAIVQHSRGYLWRISSGARVAVAREDLDLTDLNRVS